MISRSGWRLWMDMSFWMPPLSVPCSWAESASSEQASDKTSHDFAPNNCNRLYHLRKMQFLNADCVIKWFHFKRSLQIRRNNESMSRCEMSCAYDLKQEAQNILGSGRIGKESLGHLCTNNVLYYRHAIRIKPQSHNFERECKCGQKQKHATANVKKNVHFENNI